MPGPEPLVDVALYLAGAALLVALLRPWRRSVPWAAGGAYVALALAFFAPALATRGLQVASDIPYLWRPWSTAAPDGFRPANPLLGDVPLQFLPSRALVRERLLAGDVPLWAHELGSGMPLLGNGQSAVLAPLHLLALPVPAARAMTVAAAWQTLVALLLAHLLLRRLGSGHAGAALAAVAYAWSTWAVVWAYHPHAMTSAFLPGVLAGVVDAARGERGARRLLASCALGMALSGHAETLAHGAVAAAAVAAVLWVRGPRVGRARFVGALAVPVLVAAGLAAPALLPLLEGLPRSERMAAVQRAPQGVWPPPFHPRHLLPLVQPLAFGSPRDANWEGPAQLQRDDEATAPAPEAPTAARRGGRSRPRIGTNFNELCSGYVGLVPLALALAAAAVARGRSLLILAGGAVALGGALRVTPFFEAWRSLPGFEHAAHARLLLLWGLAVAVAGGLAVDALCGRRDERRERVGGPPSPRPAVAALLLAALLAAVVPVAGGAWQQAWHWLAALGAVATALALAVPRLRPAAPWLAVAAVAVDLGALGVRYQPVTDRDLRPTDGLRALLAADAALPAPGRVTGFRSDLRPNLAALYGLWDPRVYDPMAPAAAIDFVGRRLRRNHRPGRTVAFEEDALDQPLMDFLAVAHVLGRARGRLPAPWEMVARTPGVSVWRNPRALPLFHLAARVDVVPDAPAALAHALASRDFAAAVAVHDGGARVPAGPQAGRVLAVRPRPDGFDVAVEVRSPGGAVVGSSVSAAPGWQARAGAAELPVVTGNSAFLAFVAPPGRHTVRLDYRPAGWRWGLATAAATLAALGAAALVARRRRRRARGRR